MSLLVGERLENGHDSSFMIWASENSEERIRRPVVVLSIHLETLFLEHQPLRHFERGRAFIDQTDEEEVIRFQVRHLQFILREDFEFLQAEGFSEETRDLFALS